MAERKEGRFGGGFHLGVLGGGTHNQHNEEGRGRRANEEALGRRGSRSAPLQTLGHQRHREDEARRPKSQRARRCVGPSRSAVGEQRRSPPGTSRLCRTPPHNPSRFLTGVEQGRGNIGGHDDEGKLYRPYFVVEGWRTKVSPFAGEPARVTRHWPKSPASHARGAVLQKNEGILCTSGTWRGGRFWPGRLGRGRKK